MDGQLLDAVRGLTWPARRVAPAGPPGAHRSRVRGAAPEFSEYRAFRQGDDPKRLDWKLLARTNRAFLRLADDRAVLGTMLVVDASASMDFPSGEYSKWQVATRLATALAQVAHQSGDPVGLVVGESEIEPRTRRGVVNEIAQALSAVSPRGTSRLAAALTRRRLPSRVVIVSDFLDDDSEVIRAATVHRARGGEILALDVVARAELDPPQSPFAAVDPENPQVSRPFSPAARTEYQARFAEWRSATASRWRAAGTRWFEVATDASVARVVRQVIA